MLEKVATELGFFRKYHRDIESSLDEGQWKKFEGLKSNEERFNFILKLKSKFELPLSQVECDKDFDLAIKLKKLVNIDALGSSSELAVIIANRSAALYHLQDYESTIADIEVALNLGYPLELRYKAIDRKARCLLAKKHLKDALLAFRETLTALDSAKLNIERKKKWELDVQIMLGMLGKNPNLSNAPPPPIIDQKPMLSVDSSSYKSASSAIRIDKSPKMGRFAVASRNVKVGETLVFEPAYCSVLLAEHCKTHCFQCFKRVKTPLPCPCCSVVMFCGIKCQKTALTTHHKIECSILQSLWSSGASITCLMALRIISQSTLEHFLSLKPQLGQVPQVHQSGDYLDVYNLVTHEANRKSDDLFHRANMAHFLFKCLKLSGYFGNQTSNPGEDPTPSELFIGGLLLHHLQLLQFNAHEISELVLDKDADLETGQSIFLGGGLYPTLALFNHSCDPGVTRYFLGTSVVVQAVKNIQSGDMIAENYGPIFTQMTKNERQSTLKSQYWFSCNCVPCEEDWPLFNDMDPTILRFKCFAEGSVVCQNVIQVSVNTMEFLVQCPACKQHTNILKGLKALQDTDSLFKTAKNLLAKKDVLNALKTFCDLLTRLDETLAPPFRDYHLCQQGIRRCMLYLGNHFQKG
ncbi:SET and MYND domain-containing protein 4 [Gryllus bimaculatus]|nr:SET and MYND domain-containing protein 4 [Gryllus bimaculatus]